MQRDDRWAHLASLAFRIDEGQRDALQERLTAAAALLDGATEVFPPSLDPLEDFEGYAVRRLLLALRTLIEDAAHPPGAPIPK